VQITDVMLDTVDGPMRLYSCVPEGGAARAVIVIHEAGGLIDYIEDVTRRFTDAGYYAVAPALFHRAGGGTAAYGDFEKVAQLFEGLTDARIVLDVGAAVAHLHEQGFANESIGIVGFCWGGRVTFLASIEFALGAAVGFYGGGIVSPRFAGLPPLLERVGELKSPWLGLFGDRDAVIPVEDVETLRTRLTELDVPTEVVRYPTGEHGFHSNARPSYNAEDAADAWARTLAWLAEHLA
jgi:carboxymethylenebutenolidase